MASLASRAQSSSPGSSPDGSNAKSARPKRKPRQNFDGLSPAEKEKAKKANNRQAAQNLRDRKLQRERELACTLEETERGNKQLAVQLAHLEEERRAMQQEAADLAQQHIEQFRLHGLAERLMGAVRADPGNGSSIATLLAAMGAAIEGGARQAPPPVESALMEQDPLAAWSPCTALASPDSGLFSLPSPGASCGEKSADSSDDAAAFFAGAGHVAPLHLADLPDAPLDLLREFGAAPEEAQAGPMRTDSALAASSGGPSPVPDTHAIPALPDLNMDRLPTLPVLTPDSVRGAFALDDGRAPVEAQTSNHHVAAGAWPAVPPLPSGLQQLLMVLICTSLMRLPQASPADQSPPSPAPRSSPTSPRSSRSACRGPSAPLPAPCSSFLRCTKEYGVGAVCRPRSPAMLACA